MAETERRSVSWRSGLSARLLVLTVLFVMLSEVLIFAPSIGRYRLSYMQERIAAAHLASLALEVPPDNMVNASLRRQLLAHADSMGIVLKRPASKSLILAGDMPPQIDATYDLREAGFFSSIGEALMVFLQRPGRKLRIVAPSPQDPAVLVETVIAEDPMRAAMLGYAGRIFGLSLAIALMTASLVYLSLHLLLVGPMRRITESMIAFRDAPEGAGRMDQQAGRRDEIGIAQRELAEMQTRLRAALQQQARLAALGTSMSKISHDLRNILATASLVSDSIADSEDPKVTRAAPRLLAAIDRAAALCSQTLDFAREKTPSPRPSRFGVNALVEEVCEVIADGANGPDGPPAWDNTVPVALEAEADRDQLFRVLYNVIGNAAEAGAKTIRISGLRDRQVVVIEIADDGPGLSNRARETLFQPFTGSGRSGGTGLGLAIARELMRGHGGDVALVRSSAAGTVFRLTLPARD